MNLAERLKDRHSSFGVCSPAQITSVISEARTLVKQYEQDWNALVTKFIFSDGSKLNVYGPFLEVE